MNKRTVLTIGCAALLLCAAGPCRAWIPNDENAALHDLLKKAGRQVELFWEGFGSFNCTETVRQEKIGRKGKIEYRQDSVFDYLAIAQTEEEDLTIEETRIPKKAVAGKSLQPALLSTNGFPTLLLVFHPLYQRNYRFSVESEAGGREWTIGFEHVPGTPSTAALRIQDRIHPLLFCGTARIDYDSGTVTAITARLISPMKEINIEDFRIDVEYAPQSFSSGSDRWLPLRAVIDLQTALQHWRNTHRYSQYKRFDVQTIERIPGQAGSHSPQPQEILSIQ